MTTHRLSWPDVKPLQVWDLDLGDGERFWEVANARRVAQWLLEGHSALDIASCVAGGLLAGCRAVPDAFDIVYVTGGLTLLPKFKGMLRLLSQCAPWPMIPLAAGRDYAWCAKQALFGDTSVLVVDVGQTAIKGYLPPKGKPIVFTRDPGLIPYGRCADKADRSVHFIKRAIASLRSAVPKDVPLLLALPAPIDDRCVPGDSSYGFGGRKGFVEEIVGPTSAPVFVVNDAELATACVRKVHKGRTAALVVTLGLGPGAALLQRA